MDRRGFLRGAVGIIAAPAIVRASSLMPIFVPKSLVVVPYLPSPDYWMKTVQAMVDLHPDINPSEFHTKTFHTHITGERPLIFDDPEFDLIVLIEKAHQRTMQAAADELRRMHSAEAGLERIWYGKPGPL